MAAGDAGLMDFAVDTTSTVETTAPVVDTPEVGSETTVETTETQGHQQETNEDGTPKTDVTKAGGTEPANMKNIRESLKAWKESDNSPEHQKISKDIHNLVERANAYDGVFKSVTEAKQVAGFLAELAGTPGQKASIQQALDGVQSMRDEIAAVEASDALLYQGDKQVIDNVYADMAKEGAQGKFPDLISHGLDVLSQKDSAGFAKVASTLISSQLRDNGFVEVVNAAYASLKGGDSAGVKNALGQIATWFNKLEQLADKAKGDPMSDREKAFQTEKQTFETTKTQEFQKSVASDCEKYNNRTLGTALKPFLKMPFFKGFPKETLMDLGVGIKQKLFAQLRGDKAYQTQMSAMWKAKTPDKAKITSYHNAKLDSIAESVVRTVVQQRYPGYAKGGNAAGRIAAAGAAKAGEAETSAKSVATGKPIYVATKPKWDAIDWTKDPQQLLYIAGRAHLKGGKLVTWRKS